ncbi:MAG: hypothetical protein NTV68_04205 [Methanomicrobiales archaeon]|nr:hypothetical protein [Methanomicrobiales archaeon]
MVNGLVLLNCPSGLITTIYQVPIFPVKFNVPFILVALSTNISLAFEPFPPSTSLVRLKNAPGKNPSPITSTRNTGLLFKPESGVILKSCGGGFTTWKPLRNVALFNGLIPSVTVTLYVPAGSPLKSKFPAIWLELTLPPEKRLAGITIDPFMRVTKNGVEKLDP